MDTGRQVTKSEEREREREREREGGDDDTLLLQYFVSCLGVS